MVSSNFIEVIPFIGALLKGVLLGGPTVGDATIKRCFVYHCILPFIVLMLGAIHIALVHSKGQLYYSECRLPLKRALVPMHPTATIKNGRACLFYLLILSVLCTLVPDVFMNQANYQPANYLVTPRSVKPE